MVLKLVKTIACFQFKKIYLSQIYQCIKDLQPPNHYISPSKNQTQLRSKNNCRKNVGYCSSKMMLSHQILFQLMPKQLFLTENIDSKNYFEFTPLAYQFFCLKHLPKTCVFLAIFDKLLHPKTHNN